MFDSPLPVYVDSRRAFQQGIDIAGYLDLKSLPRLAQLEASAATNPARIEASLAFRIADDGSKVITGAVLLRMDVVCQRCLEPVHQEVKDEIALALVRSEELAKELNERWDPWVAEDPKLSLAPLIEEQLLLSMPIVSAHAEDDCHPALTDRSGSVTEPSSEQRRTAAENPFAVLAKLKDQDG